MILVGKLQNDFLQNFNKQFLNYFNKFHYLYNLNKIFMNCLLLQTGLIFKTKEEISYDEKFNRTFLFGSLYRDYNCIQHVKDFSINKEFVLANWIESD